MSEVSLNVDAAERRFAGLGAALNLDLWVLRPYLRQLAMFVAAMLVFGFFTGWGTSGLIIAAIYASPLASYPFAASEKNRLETMYASLPVARPMLILSRYLVTTLIWLGLTGAFAAVALSGGVRGSNPDPQEWAMLLPLAALLYAVLVGVQLPVMYRYGYTSSRLFTYLPLLLVAAVVGFLGATAPTLLEGFFAAWASLPWWSAWVAAAAILGSSYLVAVRTARLSG